MQVNDYTIKIEIETVQCSFLRFRPGGERVLPLSMRFTEGSTVRALLLQISIIKAYLIYFSCH